MQKSRRRTRVRRRDFHFSIPSRDFLGVVNLFHDGPGARREIKKLTTNFSWASPIHFTTPKQIPWLGMDEFFSSSSLNDHNISGLKYRILDSDWIVKNV